MEVRDIFRLEIRKFLFVHNYYYFIAVKYIFVFSQLKVQKLKSGDPLIYSKAKSDLAAVLTNKILQLGPTFIKLGQLLSTRVDILPREYIDKLIQLQDNVPGFSGDAALKLVEAQLGKPIDQLFDSFNSTPIAAASLGQVHIAYKNGQKLAVKVQRQGLKELFDMDLKNIKVLVKLLDKFDPKSDGAARDWSSIYDESSKLLYREIDYKAEALNSIRFKENFADVPWVKVPDVSDDGVIFLKPQLQYCIISCIIRTGCIVLYCFVLFCICFLILFLL